MIGVTLIGAGRIGKLHAKNLLAHPKAKIVSIFDPDRAAAKELACLAGCSFTDRVDEAIDAEECDAVMICSPTNTHVDLILQAASAERLVFCEKPIDLDLDRARNCAAKLGQNRHRVMIGFHRRFDPSQAALRTAIRAGQIGELEQMTIVCRDPTPPPREYLRSSGGIFRDMMIHDFDQMRAIAGIEFRHVFASGANLFDQAARQEGDWDTASAQLIGPRGETCTILNSRRCVYGFEQRIEVFGSKGAMAMENPRSLFTSYFSAEGEKRPPLLPFFPERYDSAYKQELDHFLSAIEEDRHFDVTLDDGLAALAIASAAHESAKRQVLIDLSDDKANPPNNL